MIDLDGNGRMNAQQGHNGHDTCFFKLILAYRYVVSVERSKVTIILFEKSYKRKGVDLILKQATSVYISYCCCVSEKIYDLTRS